MTKQKNTVSRREFVGSASLGAGLLIVSSKIAFAAEKNSAVAFGLIGCGGRGNNDAGKMRKLTNTRIAALADPFQDRLEATAKPFEEDSPKRFQGLDAYQKLLQTDVDAVIITSPPYFHPEHLEAAVAAKKHVYLEKPVSTDTAGALQVQEIGKRCEGISVMVGFQTRFNPDMQEAVKRVHEGAIGEIACGDGFYHSGLLTPKSPPGAPKMEERLRNWLFYKDLSGDILVEQNIHVLDACNWFLQAHPVRAIGTGGRKIRTQVGDTWDHYEVVYEYPNDVKVVFYATQFLDLGWGDVGERFNGSKGAYDGHAQPMQIRGANPWTPEKKDPSDPLQAGGSEERKFVAFHDTITSGKFVNEIAQGAESTLTAILGRTAAWKGQPVTWDEMLKEKEKFDVKLG